jgi:transposase
MNPIELAWSKLKAYLRARMARSREALDRAIPDAIGPSPPATPRIGFAMQATR